MTMYKVQGKRDCGMLEVPTVYCIVVERSDDLEMSSALDVALKHWKSNDYPTDIIWAQVEQHYGLLPEVIHRTEDKQAEP